MPTDPRAPRLAATSNSFAGSNGNSNSYSNKYNYSNEKRRTVNGRRKRADRAADADDDTGSAEWLVAAIYPATLVLASAFYLLSPSATTQDSYFARKGNLVNVLFVKYGWFWTSLAFAAHVARLRSSAWTTAAQAQAGLRWALATAWWVVVTQWCWGPPLMDRVFLITGGACHVLQEAAAGAATTAALGGLALASPAVCKLQGGQWRGGHDLSGHVFLLTHASLFLWSELLPSLRAGRWRGLANGAVLAVLALWWWMLLMTGLYFHTWTEKVCVGPADASDWRHANGGRCTLGYGPACGRHSVGRAVRLGTEGAACC